MWASFAFLLLAASPDQSLSTIEELIAAGKHGPALELLARTPDSLKRRLLASQAYGGLGDAAGAVKEAEAALSFDPKSEAAHLQLGQIFLTHNTPAAAVDIFSEALALHPQSLLLLLGRGIALKDLTRYDEAEKDLLICLRLKPGLALAFDALATVYIHSKRFEDARLLADEFKSLRPEDYRSYYFSAAAREGMQASVQEVEPLLMESIRLNPDYAASRALLGKVQLHDGRTNPAILSLEYAERLRSDYSPAVLLLAQAYRKAGRLGESAAAFQRVRELKEKEQTPRPSLRYHRGQK